MEQLVYLNGTLLPRSRARISPFDHGFLYGYALFETMRAYSGCIFHLRQHLDRLASSAKLLGLPLNNHDLEEACYETLRANKLGDARVRLTVSIGEGDSTPDPPKQPEPTVLVIASSYNPLPPGAYKRGFKTVISPIRQNSLSPLSRMKSANYLTNLLARKDAKALGADEALLLNERGFLCEGSTSNVFLVKGGSIITPGEKCGCLPGITRQAVMELSPVLGIEVIQGEIRTDELLLADEAFITSSLLELMPVTEVDGNRIGREGYGGGRGKVTESLIAAYGELVAGEVRLLP
ncbi:MAG: aminotransferase class IV [Dehalococcoidia bacterium]|nr:aminotransferase class IV [Dehalococcoidia bacterium]